MQRTMVATTEGNESSPVYQPRKGPYCLISLGYGEGSNNQNTCSSATRAFSLNKTVLRQWLVSKSKTRSSAAGCELLLRQAKSSVQPPSSPSHVRAALS